MNSIKVQAMNAKVKSEPNLAVPGKKSYLQENILHLQQIHGGWGGNPTTTKKPLHCFLLQARAAST